MFAILLGLIVVTSVALFVEDSDDGENLDDENAEGQSSIAPEHDDHALGFDPSEVLNDDSEEDETALVDPSIATDGRDIIDGNNTSESISGRGGNDVLWAHGGADFVSGDDGDDRLNGGAGADTLTGGNGRDTLFAMDDKESDFLYGGNDDDILWMGTNDLGVGGKDADTFIVDGDVTIEDFDPSSDRLQILVPADQIGSSVDIREEADGHRISVGTLSLFVKGGGQLVPEVIRLIEKGSIDPWEDTEDQEKPRSSQSQSDESRSEVSDGHKQSATATGNIQMDGADIGMAPPDPTAATDGRDIIDGNNSAESISGRGGNDVLWAHGEDDFVSGDDGDDRLNGGTGADTLTGGNGRDTLFAIDVEEADILYGGEDDDIMWMGATDRGLGGEGADTFVIDDDVTIEDFDPS